MSRGEREISSDESLAVLAGGGEMGERTRTFDWAKTPVGRPSSWPQSLRTALRIILNSRYPMFVWWGEAFTNFYNDSYIPVLGKRHPTALGRSAVDVWSEIWPVVGPQAKLVFNEGRATWNEEVLLLMERHNFLEETYFTFSYSPVPNDDGGVGGVFCACTEDTQRVLSERRLRILRALAEGASQAKTAEAVCEVAALELSRDPHDVPFTLFYLLDSEGRHAKLVAKSGLIGESAASPPSIHLSGTTATWPLHRVAESGRALEIAGVSRRFGSLPGGAWPELPERAVVLPISRPGVGRLAGFIVAGVSPRLSFDDNYRGFLDLLAEHVAAAVANARAYEEEKRRAELLAELDRAKTAFFSNVSHEFRTPLSLMLGPVEDLLASDDAGVPAAARECLETVHRNGLRLLRLVNTLLDFSRIEAGRVQARFEPTDLASLTADLASVFRSACERAGLDLVVHCAELAEPVFVDREMWEKIVLNLLSNAFKFTFEGKIEVSLESEEKSAVLRVLDTGTGIPADEMPRLFERFHRIENSRGRTHEGSGIGLALVQELVKLHGGTVRAESKVAVGTTFVVTIPFGSSHLPSDRITHARELATPAISASLYAEEAIRWLPEEDEPSRSSPAVLPASGDLALPSGTSSGSDDRARVLIADDNSDMRQYIFRLLSGEYDVETAANGEDAVTRVGVRVPDLVVADVMMPRLDGFGLLRAMRADPRTRSVPVILLSARAGEESRVEGMEAGADDYLVKPFSARELLARVGAHLQMAQLRRQASESLRAGEERLRLALTAARMVVWEFDRPADRIVVSENASAVFGLCGGATLETSADGLSLLHPEDVDRHRRTLERALEEGGSYQSQFRVIRPNDGAVLWIEERGHAICGDTGAATRLVGVAVDITDRKRVEEALHDADRRKDEFLATLAHELRNPLAPIRSGLQVMKLAGTNYEMIAQARLVMERQLEQMVRLIDDLLDVSRISTGRLELRNERIDLRSVVKDATDAVEPLIGESEHELSVRVPDEPIFVRGDAARLAQVLANLLDNAAKYTDPGGRIVLALGQEGSDAIVTVQDSGIGISAEMLTRIFEMFAQVDRSFGRSRGGLGIGLTLVKRLVEMHGGSIEAASGGTGSGSKFVVRLPLDSTSPAVSERPIPNERETPADRRRVLVADDNVDAANTLAMLIRMMGNEVRTANDGLETVEVASVFRPELILMDIGMPKLDGYAACRRIRQAPWSTGTRIVALTGWGQEEDKQRSLESGFDAHLVKPVGAATLEAILAGRAQAPEA